MNPRNPNSFSAMKSGFELHLMSHAFKKDCDDTDRKGTGRAIGWSWIPGFSAWIVKIKTGRFLLNRWGEHDIYV